MKQMRVLRLISLLLALILSFQCLPAMQVQGETVTVKDNSALDTSSVVSAYDCTNAESWSVMYPAGSPDASTWPAWDDTHYGVIATEGKLDAGSLRLVSYVGKNTGIAINAGMTPGQSYTLTLWAKGSSNAGRVLNMYANGDATIIGAHTELSTTWQEYSVTFTALLSQLNLLAADWGNNDVYLDNIRLIDANGTDLLSGKGDFCIRQEVSDTPQEGQIGAMTINSGLMCDAYNCLYRDKWVPMFPAGTPDYGHWAAWDDTHYGEIVKEGNFDIGALHLESQAGVNAAVAINPGLTAGQTYTIGMWVKGTYTNYNRVLALYANGDPAIIDSTNYKSLSSTQWTYFETTFTATNSQLSIMAVDFGNADLYIDNITLKDANGVDLLEGKGDFWQVYRDYTPKANLDFEDGTEGWSLSSVLSNTTMTAYTENVYSGSKALRVNRTKGEMDVSFVQSNSYIPVSPGDRIEFVAHVASRNCITGTFTMYLYGYAAEGDATNLSANHGQERVINAGSSWSQWDTYELTYIVPAGVNYVKLGLRVGGANADVLIDDIRYYNYAANGNAVFVEDFADPSVTTGLCGGWQQGEKSSTASTAMDGQLTLTGKNEVYTEIYTLMTDGSYTLTADGVLTDTAGQLVLEAVNYRGEVTSQTVIPAVSGAIEDSFVAKSSVYYRLRVQKTDESGSFMLKNLHIRRNQDRVAGSKYRFTNFSNFSKTVEAGKSVTFTVYRIQPTNPLPSATLPVDFINADGYQVSSGTLQLPENATSWIAGNNYYNRSVTLQLPVHLAAGTYTVRLSVAGLNVGTVTVPEAPAPALTTTSSVEVIDGRTTLLVNGQATAPMWYARPENRYLYEPHTVTKFAEVGVDTVVSYVFLNNQFGDVWTEDGFSSAAIDEMMGMTLLGNPDAKMIVAIDVNAPQWWLEANPGEVAALAESTPERTNISFASEKWKEESGQIVKQAIDYMMRQSYANQIIGFKMTGGYTLEWNWWATSGVYDDVGDFSECGIAAFRKWLTEKYATDSALQSAWGDSSVTLASAMPPSAVERSDDRYDTVIMVQDHTKMMDYELYMAQLKADTIEYFCSLVKEQIQDRLIVGTYAGYFSMGGGYEFTTTVANVYFQKLLQSENVDFIKSPWTYGMREIGSTAEFMGPVDSLDLYGKLWIVEDDTRMNLQEMTEKQDDRAAVGWTRNYQQSVEQIKRNFSYVLSKGMGVSFYNLMWNFYDDDQYYGVIGQMHDEMTHALKLDKSSTADIAVFLDGQSQMLVPYEEGSTDNSVLHLSILRGQLEELGYTGAGYNMYLLDDLAAGLVPEHKVNIFLATTMVTPEERAAIESQLQKNGNYLIWIFTSGISDGTKTDISLMQELTGMNLKVISTDRRTTGTVKISNNTHWLTTGMQKNQYYGVKHYGKLSPMIAVTGGYDAALGYHSTTKDDFYTYYNKVALAVKDMGDWTSIYSAVPYLPQQLLRNVLAQAGGHSYAESGTDVIYANSDYVALHSIFAGSRTISLPGRYNVYDVFNEKTVATGVTSFTVELTGKETRLFRLVKEHQIVIQPGLAATCTTPGMTEGRYCSVCGEVLAGQQEIPALGHTEVIDPAIKATCTTPGKTEGKHCATCGEVFVAQKDVSATGHMAMILPAVKATCTTSGKTAGQSCMLCNTVLITQKEIPATGHTPQDSWTETLAPTFTQPGQLAKLCSVCGEAAETREIPAVTAKVEQWNLSLDDDLVVNFYLQIGEYAYSQNTQIQLTVGTTTESYALSSLQPEADGTVKVQLHVPAVYMTEKIVVQVVMDESYSEKMTYTVRGYADTVLSDSSLRDYHPIVKQLLLYGGASQQYFGVNTDNLADDDITGVYTDSVPEDTDPPKAIGSVPGIHFYGASLVYRDKVAVRLYFTVTGDIRSFAAEGYTFAEKDGRYYLEIPGIRPEQLAEPIRVTVTDPQGNALTVTYSPMNYIVRMNRTGSDALKAVVEALYRYYLAACQLREAL